MEVNSGNSGSRIIFWFLKYYPVRFEASVKEWEDRNFVWEFKDGVYSHELVNTIRNVFAKRIYSSEHDGSYMICQIPASTQSKTITRFHAFVNELCLPFIFPSSPDKTYIIENGFDSISVVQDREAIHTANSRNSDIIETLSFNQEKIRHKHIILVDDVITTGRSFGKVASKLEKLGAAKVYGIFVAKTHWRDESQDDDDEIDTMVDIQDLF